MKKKRLAITLSLLKGFHKPKARLEQYMIPGELAAEVLWLIKDELAGKKVLDLGSGTGVLAIGASLLGAKKVVSVEVDERAVQTQRKNLEDLSLKNVEIFCSDVKDFDPLRIDLVVMNPPFGVQRKHADQPFLKKAFATMKKVYVIQKLESQSFLEAVSRNNGYSCKLIKKFEYPLRSSQPFHKKKVHKFGAGLFLLGPTG
ncbi:MAG: methyltransferase [Nanoarchaeota archaeon]|nr:methyltransferase [Nanoarchaeota archaeon]